jgi:hypothetical protein
VATLNLWSFIELLFAIFDAVVYRDHNRYPRPLSFPVKLAFGSRFCENGGTGPNSLEEFL